MLFLRVSENIHTFLCTVMSTDEFEQSVELELKFRASRSVNFIIIFPISQNSRMFDFVWRLTLQEVSLKTAD